MLTFSHLLHMAYPTHSSVHAAHGNDRDHGGGDGGGRALPARWDGLGHCSHQSACSYEAARRGTRLHACDDILMTASLGSAALTCKMVHQCDLAFETTSNLAPQDGADLPYVRKHKAAIKQL